MRNITVTFADGTSHTYQNAPDNVTPDQVQSRAEKEFAKTVKSLDGGRKQEAPQESSGGVGDGIASIGAGLGRGVGNTALNVQKLVGKGVDALGAEKVGQWLINDANAGQAKLGQEVAPYKERNPILTGGGELGGEILSTLPVGGLLAKGVSAIPGAARVAAPLIESIGSGGMKAGGLVGPAGLATRAAGGAITGGASAGLVDPDSAGLGALIGGAAPVVIKGAGMLGNKIGQTIRGPAMDPDAIAALKSAAAEGYVVPPTQAKPTLANRTLEGFAGKLTTAQNASAKNAEVTNKLAAKAIGLAPETKITPEVLNDIRKSAGQAYEAISNAGTIVPGKSYGDALDKIASSHLLASKGFPNAKASPVIDLVESLRSPQFDASAAVAKIKELRSAADDAFRTGNTDVARASKSAATALENAVEDHLAVSNQKDLLNAFKDARQLIAKTYTVEKALNPTTGTIDARKLGAMLDKGKPLTGDLRKAGEFANRFPKAAQTVEKMGSLPGMSPLDWAASGGIGAATGNPLALAGVLARPGARSLALSKLVQSGLTKPDSNSRLIELLKSPEGQRLLAASAPIVGTQ